MGDNKTPIWPSTWYKKWCISLRDPPVADSGRKGASFDKSVSFWNEADSQYNTGGSLRDKRRV